MRCLVLLTVALIRECAYGMETCAVYDESGAVVKSSPQIVVPKNVKLHSRLPQHFHMKNLTPHSVSHKCQSIEVVKDEGLNALWFVVTEKDWNEEDCVVHVEFHRQHECPTNSPTNLTLRFRQLDSNVYIFQVPTSFPVREVLCNASTSFGKVNESLIGRGPNEPCIISKESLQQWVNQTAYYVRQQPVEGSVRLPPKFESHIYNVSLRKSELAADENAIPLGSFRLTELYSDVSFSLSTYPENDLRFRLTHQEGSKVVELSVDRSSNVSYTPDCLLICITARVSDSEGSAFIYVRLIDETSPSNASFYEPANRNHLTIAVIVLSVLVIILLLLLIWGFFKYVGKPKKESSVCEVCVNRATKQRRPTPRIFSDYIHPLELMPKPLETLQETEVEEETESEQQPEPSLRQTIKTRKRSVTFYESDDESRQVRESGDDEIRDETTSNHSDVRA